MGTLKLYAACGLLLAIGFQANAAGDACSSFGRIAASVMERRQDGLSLQSTIEAMKSAVDADAYPLMEGVIMDAYEVPIYGGTSSQKQAVGEFRDSQQLACMKLPKPPA